jgi:oligosaccharyltransferase complex subunit alpha (ribophorin I)
VQIPELKPEEKISLVISSAYVDSLTPYPAIVAQDGKQYLLYKGEKYAPTLYTTMKQKTKIKYLIRMEDLLM